MSCEVAIDKTHTGVTLKLETKVKLLKKWGKPKEPLSNVISRVLDDAVKGVALTKDEWKLVEDMQAENLRKRMEKRAKKSRPQT